MPLLGAVTRSGVGIRRQVSQFTWMDFLQRRMRGEISLAALGACPVPAHLAVWYF
jgi:hypothetical protein